MCKLNVCYSIALAFASVSLALMVVAVTPVPWYYYRLNPEDENIGVSFYLGYYESSVSMNRCHYIENRSVVVPVGVKLSSCSHNCAGDKLTNTFNAILSFVVISVCSESLTVFILGMLAFNWFVRVSGISHFQPNIFPDTMPVQNTHSTPGTGSGGFRVICDSLDSGLQCPDCHL